MADLTPSTLDAAVLALLAPKIEQIGRQAGGLIQEHFQASELGLSAKPDNSPLTAADLASHDLISAALRSLTPDWPIISEEDSGFGESLPASVRRFWLVDPLDGTREFVERRPEYCVCIALIENGRPRLGLVHDPTQGQSYLAWEGGPGVLVFGQAPTGISSNLSLSQTSELANPPHHEHVGTSAVQRVLRKRERLVAPEKQALRIVMSRSHSKVQDQANLEQYAGAQLQTLGSALKFCRLAEGSADLYLRSAPSMAWDTAAGQCLVECAGGQVRSMLDGQPLRYAPDRLQNPGFVASFVADD